jgi:hypothetical protein
MSAAPRTLFELWLEWEVGPLDETANRPQQNFGNVAITDPPGYTQLSKAIIRLWKRR